MTILKSWGFTLMGFFNIFVLLLIASLLALRFGGPVAIFAILTPALAMMCLFFLLGEVVVNLIFDAQTPHPEHDARFLASMKRVKKKTGMWVMPRAWIIPMDQPNAMAYGPGIPGMCAVGISRKLVDMLNDDELDGVLGHEFVHILCRDTGLLAIISLALGLIDKLRGLLSNKNAMITQSPITLVIGWIIYFAGKLAFAVSRFSISQEREIAADALSAYYNDDAKPMISALRKLNVWVLRNRKEDGEKPFFQDLMVAHPGMDERIASLEALIHHETLLITNQAEEEHA
jgi:heat shock protein HtpX